MLIKIMIVLAVVVVVFLIFVALQPSDLRIVREMRMNAPADVVFAQVNDLHKFDVWNPWSKLDPKAKTWFEGPPAGIGAINRWDGNREVGTGSITVVESNPNSLIRMKLEFTKPFESTSSVEFTFKPEGRQTVVSWSNRGKSSFIPKVFCVFMSMDKMVGGMFEKGLVNLKTIAEGQVNK